MAGEDLREAAILLFGRRRWQAALAAALRVDTSTIRRWVSGAVAITGPAQAAVELMLQAKGHTIPWTR